MLQLAGSRDGTSDGTAKLHADGRFQLDSELGRGGMGVVYRARDSATGRQVALKRLSNKAKAKHVALFEREYYTLASLKHPNVVEALDYGTDSEGPWYAMELLQGGDLAQVAPLPWLEVCRILRDVASALAVLHARRLLHRDISARNVWRTQEGLIKLIDFGALSAVGRSGDLTGTPPFVAPEALHGEHLDQRTDLYSVGVLGYFLLTGLYPFPARELTDLDELWQRTPKAPSERVGELCRADLPEPPSELDALLDALLSRDPIARPGSAIELIERLDTIAPRAAGAAHEPAAAASLGSTAFIGRAALMEALRRALEAATSGRGLVIIVEAEAGLGRSRVLSEFALRVRVAGAVALQVDPAEHRGELYGIATAFALKLLDLLPDLSRRLAQPHAATLGHLSTALREKLGLELGDLAIMPETPGEARMRMQAALLDWFVTVAQERELVLLADDLHAYDDASATWLASLGRRAKDAKLVIVGSRCLGTGDLERPLENLRRGAPSYALAPLTSAETRELLRSIFGDAPRLGRLAETLHRASMGRPAHTMELVEHLVRCQAIAYVDGGWVLPQDLNAAELPQTRTDLLAARLSRLAPEARALARTLSVLDGRIPLEAAKSLAGGDAASTFATLESLTREGVLIGVDGGYTFYHDALRKTLQDELAPAERAAAHRALGDLMLRAEALSVSETLRAGVHLMLGGEFARGSELASAACRDLAMMRMAELAVCVDQVEQTLSLLRAHRSAPSLQLPVLAALTSAGFYVDRQLAMRYGSQTLEAFERATGLALARGLRRVLGRKLALIVALASAAIASGLGRRRGRVLTFRQTLLLLFNSVACLTGVYTICIDPKRAAACARVIEPLSALGKGHVASLMHEFCRNLAATVTDRLGDAYARWQTLIARLRGDEPIRDLPDGLRVFYLAGGLYASGIMASWRDDPRALQVADELDALKLKLYEMSADQIRVMYYGNQGDRETFDLYRERVEVHAMQRGTAWQAETWAAAAQLTVYLRLHDGARMKQCLQQLERVALDVPSLAGYVGRVHGIYLLLRNKPREALPWLEDILNEDPLSVVGWARGYGALARAYNLLGNHARAKELCLDALARMSDEDLSFPAMTLLVPLELAVAQAGLGDAGEAIRILNRWIGTHRAGGPLTTGALHETGVRIALATGDQLLFDEHFDAMERAYRSTKAPSLVEYCDRLNRKHRRAATSGDADLRGQELGAHLNTVLYRIRYGGSGSLIERARWALSQLSPYIRLTDGYVYLMTGGDVQRIAELTDERQDPVASGTITKSVPNAELGELDAWVKLRLEERLQLHTMTARADDLDSLHKINEFQLADRTYRLIFLQALEDRAEVVVGGLVVPLEIVDLIPHTVLEAVASRFRTLSTHTSEPPLP